jgi:excisionase family DNA binding protein
MPLKCQCEFWTIRETAQVLQCHPDTVAAMIRRGELKVVRLGRAVRVLTDSVRALIQSTSNVREKEVQR